MTGDTEGDGTAGELFQALSKAIDGLYLEPEERDALGLLADAYAPEYGAADWQDRRPLTLICPNCDLRWAGPWWPYRKNPDAPGGGEYLMEPRAFLVQTTRFAACPRCGHNRNVLVSFSPIEGAEEGTQA